MQRVLCSGVGALVALWGMAGCGPKALEPGAIDVTTEVIALNPEAPDARALGELTYRGGLELFSTAPDFGGFSALEIHDDGDRILMLSDRGALVSADLVFDEGGDLIGLQNAEIYPLLNREGVRVHGREADSEGLAHLGDGDYAISFERDHRIWVYHFGTDWEFLGTALPEPFALPPGTELWPDNAGMEALTLDSQGHVWAGVQDPLVDGQPFTLWQFDEGGDPVAGALMGQPGFALTGLTPYGEGELLALTRYWSRSVGNRARILHLDTRHLSGALAGDVLAELAPPLSVDNYEGIAYAPSTSVGARLFLVSDNNFSDDQRALLISFSLNADAREDDAD
ncbi:esterase-like activity of phytase family protein [Woodsholea maritima]|uniref:esterase-like activity of phytase family protein n=1 Tax=Woodsholea maritima TaxID=240237 RepID=UPI00039AF3BC|nr:esterase-like activity of phytase family protein [Woodsholea maritima]